MGEAVAWLAYIILGWFVVHWAYAAVMHAKARIEKGGLSGYWYAMLGPLAIIGLVLDIVLANWIVGTVVFWEFPRELTLTSRLKRHYRKRFHEGTEHTPDWREQRASWFAHQLNQLDPGHVT